MSDGRVGERVIHVLCRVIKSVLLSLLLASCIAQPSGRPEGVSQEDWDLRRGRDAFGYELRLVDEDDGSVLEVVAPRLAGSTADSEIWRIDLLRNRVLWTRPLEDEERFPDAVQFRQQKAVSGGSKVNPIEYIGHGGDAVRATRTRTGEVLFDHSIFGLGDHAGTLLDEAQVHVRKFEDLDADGVPEMLVLSTLDVWLASDWGGSLCCINGLSGEPEWFVESWEQGLGALLTALPDLDGDGVRDVLCRAVQGDSASLITVSGKSGSVLEKRSIGMDEFTRAAVVVSDLDADGIRDIAIGSASAPLAQGAGEVILLSAVTWKRIGRFTRADCLDGLQPIDPQRP